MSQPINRRELLKILAAATGATFLSSVPNKWKTPLVEVGALPAHAQGSQLPGTIEGTVTLNFADSPIRTGKPSVVPTFTISVLTTALSTNAVFDHSTASSLVYIYSISGIPTGVYTVRCSFPACSQMHDITDVAVKSGKTTPDVNFAFNDCLAP
jgi:hypothetical protein